MEMKPDRDVGRWALDVGRWMLSKKSIVYGLRSIVSPRRQAAAGFTLIELLVAMGILMIIVLMLANLFQQSTRSWDTGMRQAEIGLEARAAINLIEQDLNQAVASSNFPFSPLTPGSTLDFFMVARNPTNNTAIERVLYIGDTSGLKRNGVDLLGTAVESFTVTPLYAGPPNTAELPDLVEIALTMKSSRNFSAARVYVEGRGHDESGISLGDVIDTHRCN